MQQSVHQYRLSQEKASYPLLFNKGFRISRVPNAAGPLIARQLRIAITLALLLHDLAIYAGQNRGGLGQACSKGKNTWMEDWFVMVGMQRV